MEELVEDLRRIVQQLYRFDELPATCRTIEAFKIAERLEELAREAAREPRLVT